MIRIYKLSEMYHCKINIFRIVIGFILKNRSRLIAFTKHSAWSRFEIGFVKIKHVVLMTDLRYKRLFTSKSQSFNNFQITKHMIECSNSNIWCFCTLFSKTSIILTLKTILRSQCVYPCSLFIIIDASDCHFCNLHLLCYTFKWQSWHSHL